LGELAVVPLVTTIGVLKVVVTGMWMWLEEYDRAVAGYRLSVAALESNLVKTKAILMYSMAAPGLKTLTYGPLAAVAV
jgi:hypothetical protein